MVSRLLAHSVIMPHPQPVLLFPVVVSPVAVAVISIGLSVGRPIT